jgi:hypothetical protein
MSVRNQPQTLARNEESADVVPPGAGERFSGYGVMGLPFASGHYLAFRHMTASSVGPSYRAVWHRNPAGQWSVYADAPPEVSCARYIGSALTATFMSQIDVNWSGPTSLTVGVPGVLTWEFEISSSFATRTMSAIGARLPAGTCHSRWFLRPMGAIAGPFLSVGKVKLLGLTPNDQTFGAIPRRVWRIDRSTAEMRGASLGGPGPLPRQARLADLMMPQRGIFYAENALAYLPSEEGSPALLMPQKASA